MACDCGIINMDLVWIWVNCNGVQINFIMSYIICFFQDSYFIHFALLDVASIAFPTGIGLLGLFPTAFRLPVAFLLHILCTTLALSCTCILVQLSHGLAFVVLAEQLFVSEVLLDFPTCFDAWGRFWLEYNCMTLYTVCIIIHDMCTTAFHIV